MRNIDATELSEFISTASSDLVVALPDWEFLVEWDQSIFGRLKSGFICDEQIEPSSDSGSGKLGFFHLGAELHSFDFIERLLLTESVKLLVHRPISTFFASIPNALKSELLRPGEFSERAIASISELSGFNWAVLDDGNERDKPFLLVESQSTKGNSANDVKGHGD